MDIAAESMRRVLAVRPDINATPAEAVGLVRRAYAEPFWSWSANPHGDQARFRADTAPDKVQGLAYALVGGNRSGKSESGAYVFARHCRITLAETAKARGPSAPTVCWVVSETFEMLGEIAWKQKLQRLIPPAIIDAMTWRSKGDGWPEMVRLKNGVEIRFKSSDQGREKAQGTGLFGAWIDEQIPSDFLEEVMVRLIDHAAPSFHTFTPLSPDPTMQRRFENAAKGWRFYQTDIDDNRKSRGGHLPDEQVDLFLDRMREENPDLFDTRKSGAFAALRGAIFKTFRPSVHVIDDAKMRALIRANPGYLHYAGIDFGTNNPFCCLLGARSPDGVWYVYDEHHVAERTIEYHAAEIARMRSEWNTRHLRAAYADPGDQSATSAGGDYKIAGRAKLLECGLPIVTASKSWWRSVECIMGLLARTALTGPTGETEFGEPRLFVSARCRNLIRQLQTYRYAEGTANRDPKDAAPVKTDDHAVDALRYMIFTRETHDDTDAPVPYAPAARTMRFGTLYGSNAEG